MRTGAALILALVPFSLAAEGPRTPVIPILIAPDEVASQVSVTVAPGLQSSKQLSSAALRAARDAMHNDEPVSPQDLRALANAGDGLAAQRYVRILLADRANADPSDIAYFAAVAVGTGRVWTLRPMIAAMHELDPESEPRVRIRKYIEVLYPHAWAGNTAALDALVAFNGEGRLFGPLSDATRDRILAEAREEGNGRIELTLAMGILEAERVKETPDEAAMAQARGYLQSAAASDHLAVQTTAENLLRMIDEG